MKHVSEAVCRYQKRRDSNCVRDLIDFSLKIISKTNHITTGVVVTKSLSNNTSKEHLNVTEETISDTKTLVDLEDSREVRIT